MMRRLHHLDSAYSASPSNHGAAAALAVRIRAAVINKCREHDRQLLGWAKLVFQLPKQLPPEPIPDGGDPDGKPQCTAPPGSNNTNDGPDISQQALIIHVAQVHGMALYWTTALVLYTIMQVACTARLSFEPQPTGAALAPSVEAQTHGDIPGASFLAERFNPLTHANHLVDAISVLLQPSAGLYGHRSAALPLEVALEYVSGMSTEMGAPGDDIETQNIHGDKSGTGEITSQRRGAEVLLRGQILDKLKELKKKMDKGIDS